MALLQGEATEEVCPVDDQKEVAARSTDPGQPPRSQEGRRKRGRIHQLIPLRSPPVEVGGVEQAGWSHYRISRRVIAIGEGAHLTPTVFPRPAETFSRSLCWLLTAIASVVRDHFRESWSPRATRIVFSSDTRYWPAIGSHGARRRARSAGLARLIHFPTAVNRSFPAAVDAQTAIVIRQASG